AVALAVNAADAATPLELVTAVFTPPAKEPLAPLPGAVNVTVTPGTRLLNPSLTVACSGEPNAEFTAALWGVPPVAVMVAGAPAVLVRLKLAGVPTPDTVPVTE